MVTDVVDVMEAGSAPPRMPLWYRFSGLMMEYGIHFSLVFFILFFSVVYRGDFLNKFNFINAIANGVAFTMIVGVGVMIALVAGQVDMSGAAQLTFGAMVFSGLVSHMNRDGVLFGAKTSVEVAALITVLILVVVGLLNGILVVNFGIYSILATFPMSLLVYTMAGYLGEPDGFDNYLTPGSPSWDFVYFANEKLLTIPVPIYIAAVTVVVGWVLLERTRLGAHLRAAGGNPGSAVRAGIPVSRLYRYTFVFSSITVSIGTYVLVGQNGQGGPGLVGWGAGASFDALTVALIGGAGLSGGLGRLGRMLLGALLLAVIGNGITLSGYDNFVKGVVGGLILVLAVISSSLARKRLARGG